MAAIRRFTINQFADDPGAPSVTPATPGLTTWGYKIVGVAADGTTTAASSEGTTVLGTDVIDETDLNTITWTDPDNVVSIRIYRTTVGDDPTTTGLIGEVNAGIETFDDTGLVADGSTAPSTNTTGNSEAIAVEDLREILVQFYGTFASTNQLQGSIDGENWEDVGSAATSPGFVSVEDSGLPLALVFLRVKQTAFTSGTVSAIMAGHEER